MRTKELLKIKVLLVLLNVNGNEVEDHINYDTNGNERIPNLIMRQIN